MSSRSLIKAKRCVTTYGKKVRGNRFAIAPTFLLGESLTQLMGNAFDFHRRRGNVFPFVEFGKGTFRFFKEEPAQEAHD